MDCTLALPSQLWVESLKDESHILQRVLSGETSAFEEIILNYKPHVFKIVSNMVASQDIEEVAHEAFIRAFKDLASFRGDAPFEHWLARVTVRTCYDYWRRERRQRVVSLSDTELDALERQSSVANMSEESAISRAKDLLDTALNVLSPSDRLAFSLLYLEGMSMKEVAEYMGWSIAQVKIRSFRARHKLRSMLTGALE